MKWKIRMLQAIPIVIALLALAISIMTYREAKASYDLRKYGYQEKGQ